MGNNEVSINCGYSQTTKYPLPKSGGISNGNYYNTCNDSQLQKQSNFNSEILDGKKSYNARSFSNNINFISDYDSFTQYSYISGINDNHFYQEINYQPTANEIISNKLLVIEDVEGDLFFNQKLFLDAGGLKNGLRGKKDGFTFFGSLTHYHGKVINDFVLNLKDEVLSNLKVKIYFAIFFDRTLQKFFFKNVKKIDYNNISKIDFSCVFFTLEKNECEMFNKNLVQFSTCVNFFFIEILNDSSIKVDIISKGRNNNVECSFCFAVEDSPVTIGVGGKIPIEKKKNLAAISYDQSLKKWFLKEKVDDLWIGCDKKIELVDTKKFKIDKDIFEISTEKE